MFTPNTISCNAEQNTNYEVKVVEPRLAPGDYYINVSIVNGNLHKSRHSYDYIMEGPLFTITQFTEEGISVLWSPGYGSTVHQSVIVKDISNGKI